MFFGKSAPAPPPSFLEDAFQQATAKAEELTAQIKTKVEELAAANDLPVEQMWTVIGGTLLLLVGFLAMRSNKKIVATCELGAAGKPCGTSPNKGITPMRSPSDLTTAHLDRRPSAKQFVPERASKVTGTVTLTQENGITTIEYKVVGLEPGKHGFHIHETADFSNGCVSAGVRSLRLRPRIHTLDSSSFPRGPFGCYPSVPSLPPLFASSCRGTTTHSARRTAGLTTRTGTSVIWATSPPT